MFSGVAKIPVDREPLPSRLPGQSGLPFHPGIFDHLLRNAELSCFPSLPISRKDRLTLAGRLHHRGRVDDGRY
jgi:hypothetical protein